MGLVSGEKFTGILAEIEMVAGAEAALKIAQSYGGIRVGFPAAPPPGHWLVTLLGETVAREICSHFAVGSPEGRMTGLREVIIPIGPVSTINAKRQLVLAEFQKGSAIRAAARAANVHERTAFRWHADAKRKGLL